MNDTLTSVEPDIYIPTGEGIGWLQNQPDLCRQYAGQWVVVVPERIVASGSNPDQVQCAAAEQLGFAREAAKSLIVTFVTDMDTWMDAYA